MHKGQKQDRNNPKNEFLRLQKCGFKTLLKQPARSLLAGSAMTSGYKSSGKRFQRLPLYFRLILRNMRKDWQRVLITVSSIAGCCVLMIVGLTFSFTLKNTLGERYNSIIRYDAELYFDPQSDTSAENQIRSILEDNHDTAYGLCSLCFRQI